MWYDSERGYIIATCQNVHRHNWSYWMCYPSQWWMIIYHHNSTCEIDVIVPLHTFHINCHICVGIDQIHHFCHSKAIYSNISITGTDYHMLGRTLQHTIPYGIINFVTVCVTHTFSSNGHSGFIINHNQHTITLNNMLCCHLWSPPRETRWGLSWT